MAGRHDSIMIRVPTTLHERLRDLRRRFVEWAANNPGVAPDYLLTDPVPIDAAILHLIRFWEKKQRRSYKSRAAIRARRSLRKPPLVGEAKEGLNGSGVTPAV